MSRQEDRVRRWQRWEPALPFVLLALATAVALPTAPVFGTGSPRWLAAQGVLVLVTAAWSWWWTVRDPSLRTDRRAMAVHFVVRTVLAFALTWINPFYALFAWVGFLDHAEVFRGRARQVAILAVAATVAGSQSGGLPPTGWAQALAFVVLVLVNAGLATFFGLVQRELDRRAEEQTRVIAELERVNGELQRALTENAALHEELIAQAHRAGVQEERQRLAREIHDTIAQSLAASLTQLQAAQAGGDPRDRLARATDLTREALAEARRSVLDLAPEPLAGAGLAEALERFVAGWRSSRQVRAEVTVSGRVRPLHPEVESTVLRIAQEALANVAKHADADRVGLTLVYDEDEVILDVRDDGAGFDPSVPPAPASFGLRGMRQRAGRLAGELHVESSPGNGTAVSVRLPALARKAAA